MPRAIARKSRGISRWFRGPEHWFTSAGFPIRSSAKSWVVGFANGLGTTLLPKLAVDGGSLLGTNLVTRGLGGDEPARKVGLISLIWRRGAGRRNELGFSPKSSRSAPNSAPNRRRSHSSEPSCPSTPGYLVSMLAAARRDALSASTLLASALGTRGAARCWQRVTAGPTGSRRPEGPPIISRVCILPTGAPAGRSDRAE
jgi:hypothetical protein